MHQIASIFDVATAALGASGGFCSPAAGTAETREKVDLETSFDGGGSVFDVDGIGQRLDSALGEGTQIRVDAFGDAACLFVRGSERTDALRLGLEGKFIITAPLAGGWLASPSGAHPFAYWSPTLPRCRRLNARDHVLAERDAELAGIQISADRIQVTVDSVPGHTVDCVVWRLPVSLAHELQSAQTLEQQRYFLWGSHTSYIRLADLYRHLVFGAVYEDRFSWPHTRRICSENDAHALYVLLTGLARSTGKRVYDLLRRQIVLSVLARQAPDGAFRHGEWTDDFEVHFRLHCSGMHLMMDSLVDFPSQVTTERLKSGATFLQTARSPMSIGTWFLHDELEQSDAAMDKAPFRWLSTQKLGKTRANMLVLNTNIDATIALHRYACVTGDTQFAEAVTQAFAATRHLLQLHPLEWVYRLAFWPVSLTLLPKDQQERLPLMKRIAKRIGWRFIAPNLHHLKARFPRLVMPGGYIDRAIPLGSWAFHYHTVNLMDLIRQARRLPSSELDAVIEGALRFTHDSGVLDRWSELRYERYALGFWAEALYQHCFDHPEATMEGWLADATLRLHDLGMGLPPSVLGANAEITATSGALQCPQPPNPTVRFVVLGRPEDLRLLAVNCGTAAVDCPSLGGARMADTSIEARGWRLFHLGSRCDSPPSDPKSGDQT
jgi:hypothetical protein